MRVEIKLTAEVDDDKILEEAEKGFTKESIIDRLYHTLGVRHDLIWDYEVDSIEEVK